MAVVAQTDTKRGSVLLSTIILSVDGRAAVLGSCEAALCDGRAHLGDPVKYVIDRKDIEQWAIPETGQGSITERLAGPTLVVLFAWALLECNNVGVRELHPSTRLEKAKSDPTRIVYRELVIKPAPGQRRVVGQPRADERGTALHIVRGHFKEYDDKPLFGRLKGRWFWPSHVAGDVNYGTVLKSYSIGQNAAEVKL